MGIIKIKRGLDLPIAGAPTQEVSQGRNPKKVALIGDDYIGMKPTMLVQVGEKVKLGQPLFTDKKMPRVQYTSPGAGTVVEINRGEKRIFQSLVIELDGNEEVSFTAHKESELEDLSKETVTNQLIESGLWTAIRTRPFSKVANPDDEPHSLFITAMDSNPLAPSIEKILVGKEQHFISGLKILAKLTSGKVFLCKATGSNIPTEKITNLQVEEFSGPHPAGLPGTHIHFLDPVHSHKKVFYIAAQDVAQIGAFFATGKIDVERVISIAGPRAKNPRLIKTRIGAMLSDIIENETTDQNTRIVSGSVLNGRTATPEFGYLGRFHQQITLLEEGTKREFLGWLSPGGKLHSIKKILLSSLMPGKKFDFTTSFNGGHRSIVPIGSYESVMPLDLIPTYLLRSLAVDDVEESEKLGCLELDEEDLALCTYVCPSKNDHGKALRRNLTLIEKEG